MKIKLERDFFNYKKNQIINIKCDGKNIPLDIYWRRRIKDKTCSVYYAEVKDEQTKVKVKLKKIKNKGENV